MLPVTHTKCVTLDMLLNVSVTQSLQNGNES